MNITRYEGFFSIKARFQKWMILNLFINIVKHTYEMIYINKV